ncbi:MAG: tetratricopeptide repeat protein [Candidatus Levybacteria bacterium]|nr:tetratricopeptide repeat protein [Candidatus Levybacteria bacterium]
MISLKDQAINTALNGDWEKAISLNKALVKANPNDVDALNRLAFALHIQGKTQAAKTTYQKVLKIDGLNSLALRNLKKLLESKKSGKNFTSNNFSIQTDNLFLEEPGKTKIIELVNIAQPNVINMLRTGQILMLCVKRLKIFLLAENKIFVGMLPDNISKRLIKFIKAGNEYNAYVKSANNRRLVVFIKETKKSSRFKDQFSFLSGTDKALDFDSSAKLRAGKRKSKLIEEKDENDGQDYDSEDES